jgi:hypothetical protein
MSFLDPTMQDQPVSAVSLKCARHLPRQRRLHGAPADTVQALKFSPGHACSGVTTNRGVQLDPRLRPHLRVMLHDAVST